MKNLFFFLILFSLSIAISCKKEEIPEKDCEDIENINAEVWPNLPLFISQGDIYSYPQFNPNNPEEIIFLLKNSLISEPKLIKYNIRTNEHEEIIVGSIPYTRVRWNKNDWLILAIQYDIWKIKSSGDSLTQLTFSGGRRQTPEWNITGDKFTYRKLSAPRSFVVAKIENLEIDTFENGIKDLGSWQHPSKFCYTDTDGLLIGDFLENNTERVFTIENPVGGVSGCEWIDERNIVWTDNDGVYISNIDTKSRETILSTCNSKWYSTPDYSPQSNKLLMIRNRRVETSDEGGDLFREVVIMNLDGTDEQVIEIEE